MTPADGMLGRGGNKPSIAAGNGLRSETPGTGILQHEFTRVWHEKCQLKRELAVRLDVLTLKLGGL